MQKRTHINSKGSSPLTGPKRLSNSYVQYNIQNSVNKEILPVATLSSLPVLRPTKETPGRPTGSQEIGDAEGGRLDPRDRWPRKRLAGRQAGRLAGAKR